MELKIGPYTITKRTEYSKFQVLDDNKNNITKTNIGKRILSDYDKQISTPDKYFIIKDGELISFNDSYGELNYIFIPDGVTTIASQAFEYRYFDYIYFPPSMDFIGDHAFSNCTNLKEVSLPHNVNDVLGFGVFSNCRSLEKIDLPSTLTVLPNCTFTNCLSLKKIDLPETLLAVREFCFDSCVNLTNIYLPDSVSVVGSHAFDNCRSLKEINIPKSLNFFGEYIFDGSGVERLIFNNDLDGDRFYGDSLDRSKVREMIIMNTVTFIDPIFFNSIKDKIKRIDYIGTRSQFEEFKRNNKHLFKMLKNAKIDIFEESIEKYSKNTYLETKNAFESR